MKEQRNGGGGTSLVEIDVLHEVGTFFGPICSQARMSFRTKDTYIKPWGHT